MTVLVLCSPLSHLIFPLLSPIRDEFTNGQAAVEISKGCSFENEFCPAVHDQLQPIMNTGVYLH